MTMKYAKYLVLILSLMISTVAFATVGVITGSMTVCVGGSTTLSDSTAGGTWSSSNTAVATVDGAGMVTGVSAGTVIISYTAGPTVAALVTVNMAPAAITGSSALCAGGMATLSDATTGGIWTSASPAIATIGSATGSVTGLTAGMANITYTLGTGCAATSTIIINSLPSLFTVLGGGQYCAGGAGVHYGLNGSATGVNYQLYLGGIPIGAPMAGIGDTLDFGMETMAGTYTVVATSAITGCTRNMTGATSVIVNSIPVVHNVTGGGAICAGSTGQPVGLDNSNPGIGYQLFNGSSPVGTPIPGTGASLNFGNFTAAGAYIVAAGNITTGCNVNMAGSAAIAINPLPVAYMITGGGGYCAGGAGTHIGLNNSDPGISYQLFVSGVYTGLQQAGSGSALDFGAQIAAGIYTVLATDVATGCIENMIGSNPVFINPLPNVYVVGSSPAGYCVGGSGIHISLSGSQTGISYKLYRGPVVAGIVAGTNFALDFGPQTIADTAYTVAAFNTSTSCASNMLGHGNIVVYSLPAVHTVTGGGSYCSGGTGVSVNLNASSTGITYQLYIGTTAIGLPVAGTGAALDFGPQTAAGTYTAIATNPATSCSSNMTGSATVSITPPVVPSVTILASSDSVCAGTMVTYVAIPVNGGTAPTHVWTINGVNVALDDTFSFVPVNGDNIQVKLTSNATCALPATILSAPMTMDVVAVPAISGTSAICLGSSTSLADTMAGGAWTSANPGVAIISTIGGTTGVVTGVSVGTVNMTYTIGMGCYTFVTITVNAVPTATATVTAAACGGSYTLAGTGGTTYSWAPTTGLACDSCDTTTVNPAHTTTYTVTASTSAGCTNTASVTVNGNRISGYISYAGVATDVFKVWLIQFNPSDSSLLATDSTLTCMDGGNPYYEFDGKPAGNYIVKAALIGAIPGTSGYIPTYSLATPYWYSAAGTTHVAATDTLHINMMYGTVPVGPGFIGGLISAGAGKGTAGNVPASGMLVYLVDAVSNFVLTYTYTDAEGNYSFSNIAEGNYLIYPEALSFATIPSAVIMLGGTADSSTGINFRQLNNSRLIKPVAPVGVKDISGTAVIGYNFKVFPNPASGTLYLQWDEIDNGTCTVTLMDLLGHNVFSTAVNIDDAKLQAMSRLGLTQIKVSGLSNGIYIMTIKGAQVNRCGQVVVRN
jgi:uncharacterized protein YjdB